MQDSLPDSAFPSHKNFKDIFKNKCEVHADTKVTTPPCNFLQASKNASDKGINSDTDEDIVPKYVV